MVKMAIIKKVKTYKDLVGLGIGKVYCDISYRGGGIGFFQEDIARYFEIANEHLPGKFGAYCNYLGGGLRGSINTSGFSDRVWEISKKTARLLEELQNACVRIYENIDKAEIEDDVMQGVARVNVKSA
jgi:hypothetical protein